MVTVLTDINPKGNYLIFMPKDTKLVENQASAIDAKFQSLKQQTDELRSSIFALKAALREWSGDEVTSDKFGKDEVGGDIPSVDAAKNYGVIYRCKKGTFAVGIYHLSDGIRQQLVCRAINTEGAK